MGAPIGGDPSTWGPQNQPIIGGDGKTDTPKSSGDIGGDPNTWPPVQNLGQVHQMVGHLVQPEVFNNASHFEVAKEHIQSGIRHLVPEQTHLAPNTEPLSKALNVIHGHIDQISDAQKAGDIHAAHSTAQAIQEQLERYL